MFLPLSFIIGQFTLILSYNTKFVLFDVNLPLCVSESQYQKSIGTMTLTDVLNVNIFIIILYSADSVCRKLTVMPSIGTMYYASAIYKF